MKHATKAFIAVAVMTAAWRSPLQAQGGSEEYEKFNTNIGMPVSVPLNPTSQFANVGVGVVYGAGFNFTKRHAVTGEFMWNWLNPSGGALRPIQAALQDRGISGHSNLFSLSGNYRFELRGKVFGTYFIGGGGWYYRRASLSRSIPTGTSVTCEPAWIWWGYDCTSGTVFTNQTLVSSASSAFGGNAGIGFTVRVGEAPYRFYIEPRYHYAPNKNFTTQLITITVGFRY